MVELLSTDRQRGSEGRTAMRSAASLALIVLAGAPVRTFMTPGRFPVHNVSRLPQALPDRS